MSRVLFTVGPHVYELTPSLRRYFIDHLSATETFDAWFEQTEFCHAVIDGSSDDVSVTVERVDIATVFETFADDAIDLLDDAGATPLFSAPTDISASGSALVLLDEQV